MQSAGHEIVHQIVAAGNRVENVGDATGLVGFGDLSETKVSLIGRVHGWHPPNRPVRNRTFFKAGTQSATEFTKPAPFSGRCATSVILNYGGPSRQTPARTLIAGIRDQGSGIRDQGSGIRDQGSGIRDQGSEDVTGGFAAARMLGCEVLPPPPARSAHEFLIPDP
jgi:hypothetical protein